MICITLAMDGKPPWLSTQSSRDPFHQVAISAFTRGYSGTNQGIWQTSLQQHHLASCRNNNQLGETEMTGAWRTGINRNRIQIN
jgi:hypothetical protein